MPSHPLRCSINAQSLVLPLLAHTCITSEGVYVCVHACMHVCVCLCVHACVYECMCMCARVHVHARLRAFLYFASLRLKQDADLRSH